MCGKVRSAQDVSTSELWNFETLKRWNLQTLKQRNQQTRNQLKQNNLRVHFDWTCVCRSNFNSAWMYPRSHFRLHFGHRLYFHLSLAVSSICSLRLHFRIHSEITPGSLSDSSLSFRFYVWTHVAVTVTKKICENFVLHKNSKTRRVSKTADCN